jgi:hypothetical protein
VGQAFNNQAGNNFRAYASGIAHGKPDGLCGTFHSSLKKIPHAASLLCLLALMQPGGKKKPGPGPGLSE